eukprot:TRINITY_DN72693_c0_g1_i1.p1 TRINITY_DN72693_c0_g1~~TRINITY_DN72693_c0_g1_i1.p1  ORF type:complete len:319 (-),score=46.64 TRINITY_DN72693_c0_g1_i1:150-1106(-)
MLVALVLSVLFRVNALILKPSDGFDSLSANNAENFMLSVQQCHDEANSKIHPIVQEVANFWTKKGVHVQPAALTLMSAIRFGGISNRFKNNRVHTFDRDLDFLLTFPNGSPSPQDVDQALADFRSSVSSKWNVTEVFSFRDGTNGYRKHKLRHFTVNFQELSEVSDFNVKLDALNVAREVNFAMEGTTVDFWIEMDGPIYEMMDTSNAETVILAGVPFKYLYDDKSTVDMLARLACKHNAPDADFFMQHAQHESLCENFKDKGKLSKMTLCDFARPGNVIYDSSEVVRDEDGVFESCAKVLQQYGYKNLAGCYGSDRS